MSRLRDYLKQELKKKLDRYGIVVWVDEHGEYGPEVARAIVPDDARFFVWDGSWYALRRQLEPLIDGSTPPRLLIYQGVRTPEEDPLAEVRYAGTEWKIRLATLIRNALKGELSTSCLEELASQASTLAEAEAAMTAGPIVEVRLQAALGSNDPVELGLRLLADPTDEILEKGKLWEDARRFLKRAFGGEPRGTGKALRNSVFRHLVLLELSEALAGLPEGVGIQPGEADEQQRSLARELLARWRRDIERAGSYRDLALQAERDLGLARTLSWDDRLSGLDTVPVIEELALSRTLELLEQGALEEAKELASSRRERSFWVRSSIPEARGWQRRWEAVRALVELRNELTRCTMPKGVSAGEILQWYVRDGWRVDQAHRRFEAALTELYQYGLMEPSIQAARSAYEAWLEELLSAFTEATKEGGLEHSLLVQTQVFKEHMKSGEGKVAYLLVDALRYELGQELALSLQDEQREVQTVAAVATPPTVTTVGMAALLPRAERGLGMNLSGKGNLEIFVDGVPMRTVHDRLSLIRASEGEVADFLLNQLFDLSENELRGRIGSAHVVVVRSQEIDQAFESDNTAAAWHYVGEIRGLLDRAIARLSAAGVERFIIAADHGFLILSRPLGPERTIDPPGGQGKLHRRFWLGRGGSTSSSVVRFPLADFEVSGGLDLVVPKGLAIFKAGGARRFLHGGLSPQELVVPIITVQVNRPVSPRVRKIDVIIVGNRITTGVFSASLSFSPDLFATEMKVRVSARNRKGKEVARIVAGENYDEATGVVCLSGGETQIVTLRVVTPLKKGDRVTLQAYDAETDRLLGKSKAAEVLIDIGTD